MPDRWKCDSPLRVCVESGAQCVSIHIAEGALVKGDTRQNVYPPNWFERNILGRTYAGKVSSAYDKAVRQLETLQMRKNEAEEAVRMAVE